MAGISHFWTGTVLTVISDAGTSSADLSGATGPRGPQGRPGVIYDAEGNIIVSDIASADELESLNKRVIKLEGATNLTPEYVELQIAAGLDNYYDKQQVDAKLKNVSVDLTGYATESYVKDEVAKHPTYSEMSAAIAEAQLDGDGDIDLSGYATKTYVDESIANAQIGGSGSGVDLSNYATKSYVDQAVANVDVDMSNYYTITQTQAYVQQQRVAIEAWVNEKFAAIGTSEGVEY